MDTHVCCVANDVSSENEDPGAAPYGNFINYYTFNPPENRLSLIPPTLLQDLGYGPNETVAVLDVGCNSGELTVALYKHLHQECPPAGPGAGAGGGLNLLGFDLDETLIQRAQSSNPFPGNVSFIPLDITQDEASRAQLDAYLRPFGRRTFHLSVCLAVTMWVHLNHGDAGLLGFLSRLAALSEHLLLEAQPWKCYRSAARRLRKVGRDNFEHFKTLQIRGDMAENVRRHLESSCGMELVQSFGSTNWDRKLLLFRKHTEKS